MIFLIFFIVIFICLLLYYLNNLSKIKYKEKNKKTSSGMGFSLKLVSFIAGENISDFNKNDYKKYLDKIINNLHRFNKDKRVFNDINNFTEYFWKFLTNKNNYISHVFIIDIVIFFVNNNYKGGIKYIIVNLYRIPYILYDLYKNINSSKELFTNIALLETLIKAFQISSIMNTDLYTVIKRMRLIRNIPIVDKKSGKKMITRQVRFPMIGSEVCPYINYVNKCEFINVELKYSILVVEDNVTHHFYEYNCEFHDACIVYRNKNYIEKHLEDFDFWKDDDYWKIIYPEEKEIQK
jgi:hypothetical protein